MSYYDQPRKYRPVLAEDLVELRTPGFVLSEMNTVESVIVQLKDDIAAAGMAGTDFAKAFVKFFQEWREFYNANKSGFGAWWARGTTAVYNKTVEFRNRALDWANKFKSKGGKTEMVLPPKKTESFARKWGGWLILTGIGLAWYFSRGK